MSRMCRAGWISASALVLLITIISTRPSYADPWSEVGAPSRPSWVFEAAERRLRMLPALTGIKDSVEKQANAYFGSKGPGMTIGLVLDDETGLFYSQGFGFSDANLKNKPDEYTIYRPGSFSKVITGTGLLTLIDESGKPGGLKPMSLDDHADEDRYLPELKSVCPPPVDAPCARGSQSLGITLANLVSHTSGLPNVFEQNNGTVCPWLSDLEKTWLAFTPGTDTSYSGVGVEGVGLIEQRLSKKAYVDFIHDSIFKPLGMDHSSMDQTKLPQSMLAQNWNAIATPIGWTFTKAPPLMYGDAPPVPPKQDKCEANYRTNLIQAAGGYATNVRDHSLFLRAWLRKDKKGDTRRIVSQGLMNTAIAPRFPPPANLFGVNWWIVTPGAIVNHNGSEIVSGSQTQLDFNAKMGATALISTNPYGPAGFADNIAINTVLAQGETADKATTWSGKALSIAVARVLYLSGKTPQVSDLDDFKSSFIKTHALNTADIVSYLSDWQRLVGQCRTFRVRDVESDSKITVRFYCTKREWDAVLEVDKAAPFKIAWTGPEPTLSPAQGPCLAKCSTQEGTCMDKAHSSSDRQMCIHDVETCDKACY